MSNEKKWTDGQLNAITHTGSDLIVAAAAGSGKTATLTERVIRRIVNGECDIEKMLIVTFTKAAAEELRIRIRQELTKKSMENFNDTSLKLKLMALNSAQISTIHGFCSSLIKENYAMLGLPAGMRIAEDSESLLLKKRVMDRVIDNFYENDVPEKFACSGFEDMVDCLIKNKTTDGLNDILTSVFNKICSSAQGADIIRKTAENFYDVSKNGFFASPYSEVFSEIITELSDHYVLRFSSFIAENSSDEMFFKKYYPALCDDLAMLESVQASVKKCEYENALKILCKYTFSSLGRATGEYDWKETAKKLRAKLKKDIEKLKIFDDFTDNTLSDVAEKGGDMFNCLYNLIEYFDSEFEREKIKRKIMDYNDLERYTYRLLYNENGLSDLAISLKNKYSEIYVDEYQDCNSLQDMIFAALADKNRFMVGDIKQSIYGFRGAEPDLFSEYRTKFGSDGKCGRAIFLSNNFRCSENIIDFSNLIFSSVFAQTPSVPYTDADALVFSKTPERSEKVTLSLVEYDEEQSGDEEEAKYVADTIKYLIENEKNENGKNYTPGDFAILFRSVKKNSSVYENELKKRGIPVYNGAEKSFFESSEVLLAVCLLSAIDNPMRDIQLAGLMQSPLYGFTLDEMIKIRKGCLDLPLYDSLVLYAENTQCPKAKRFLEKLELYRRKAQSMQTDKLVWYLFNDTGIFASLHDLGEESQVNARRANLMTFYEFARKFESGAFKGLYNFINYINELIEKKTKLETVKAENDYDTSVKIMTIHKSKGLEFPVCFICNTAGKLESANRDFYKYDKKYGFCVKIRDESGFAMYKTPMYECVSQQQHRKTVEEEGRLLYVAMTRARHRLYITCNTKSAEKLLDSSFYPAKMTPYDLYSSGSYIQMILRSLYGESEGKSYIMQVINGNHQSFQTDAARIEEVDKSAADAYYEKVKENLSFEYPYAINTTLPKKVSVSRLYPDMLDNEDEASVDREIPIVFEDPYEIRRANDAAQKGIATHLFMQFCDFDLVVKNGVRQEAARLVEYGFIPQSAHDDIDFQAIEPFFSSELFKAVSICKQKCKLLYREYRFNINLDASLFTSNVDLCRAYLQEKILVQGVVDLFFENEDGTLTLVDYKTDRISNEASSVKYFVERHRTQLEYYKIALERITKKNVKNAILYSFSLGREINIDL